MNIDLLKPSVAITFDESFTYQHEFVDRLKRTGLFSMRKPTEDYFTSIASLLLDDKDPVEFIMNNEPVFEREDSIEINVAGTKANLTSFVYFPEMTDSDFNSQALNLLQKYKNNYFKIISENSGLNFYKKYLGTDCIKKKRLGDAFFYFQEYENALSIYSKLKNEYPMYCNRRIGWCKILLNQIDVSEPHIFDIFIFYSKYNSLYYTSKNLERRIRSGVEYLLSKKYLSPEKRLLIFYNCFKNFMDMRMQKKVDEYIDLINNEIRQNGNTDVPERKDLWLDVRNKIEAEFHTYKNL